LSLYLFEFSSFQDCGREDTWRQTLLALLASLWRAGPVPQAKEASTASQGKPLWVTA
tara:strand:+ start:210 stop:380 length:171 start_codon:yes stop_codon:yes gene_type:complete